MYRTRLYIQRKEFVVNLIVPDMDMTYMIVNRAHCSVSWNIPATDSMQLPTLCNIIRHRQPTHPLSAV